MEEVAGQAIDVEVMEEAEEYQATGPEAHGETTVSLVMPKLAVHSRSSSWSHWGP